ncbi:MAG TPA: iron-containing redox enzyme family protein [Streptosporangiaceae bacterium]
MEIPTARGPLSAWLTATLRADPAGTAADDEPPPLPEVSPIGPAESDDDLQLALWCCYELHYQGFDDADEEWEWHPAIVGFRRSIERPWLARLRVLAGEMAAVPAARVPAALGELTSHAGGPDLAGYLARTADRGEFAEYLVHRSVYQLKEADPHSFAIPRLSGPVKAALVEIQADEYGAGRPERMHAELFRATMGWLGLDDRYGYYVPAVPALTLAVSNLMSLFALNRRWVGALLGHLAALEMTSTGPNRRYSAGARRLGASEQGRRYFDEHVEADAVHEQIAAHDLCGGYAAQRPGAAADILFGASCCLALDNALATHLLSCWRAGLPSLRQAAGPELAR